MVAVGLAVGRDMHQLRTRPFVGKPAQQAVREFFAVVEQFLERDSLRNRAVIKEEVYGTAATAAGTDKAATGSIFEPQQSTHPPPSMSRHALAWWGARMANFRFAFASRSSVSRSTAGFGQPHRLRLPPEAALEIGDAPHDLRPLVARVGKRHDDVVVALRDGRAVSGKQFPALFIGL